MTNALTSRTWYDDTAIAPPHTTALDDAPDDFEDAIIGGGLAGLTLLERLTKAGRRVVLLEHTTIGAGASGRNAGFCSPGWAADTRQISRIVGDKNGAMLTKLADQGLSWMKARAYAPGWEASSPTQGVMTVSLSGRPTLEVCANKNFRDQAALALQLSTRRYRYGVLSPVAFHFHPLNFVRLLAQEALDAGGQILEHSPLLSVSRQDAKFHLSLGGMRRPLRAKQIIFATGGYGGTENRHLAHHLLPIRTYIGVSEPMRDVLDQHIQTNCAFGDTRRAGNYYRRLPDGRLMWGVGFTAFGTLSQEAVKAMVMRDIRSVYPEMAKDMQAAGKGLDYGWAGNMAYARHFLPYVAPLGHGAYALTGFGGHGMNTAPAAAMALADHLTGQNLEALEPFSAIPMRHNFGPLGRLAAEGIYRAMLSLDWGTQRLG